MVNEDEDETPKTTKSSESLKSEGMGASLRMTSTDIRTITRELETPTSSKLTPEGGGTPGHSTYDCIAFLIYCGRHKKFALSKAEKTVWMPFVVNSGLKTYALASEEGLRVVMSRGHRELDATLQKGPKVKKTFITNITRVQLPDRRFISRLTRFVRLDNDDKDFPCCKDTNRIKWVSKQTVLEGSIDKVWGPEVRQYANDVTRTDKISIHEYSIEQVFKSLFSNSTVNLEEKLSKELQIQRKDIEKLYVDFIEHCFPSFYMSFQSFSEYMTTFDFDCKDSQFEPMFDAFTSDGNDFVNFQDLMLGLVAMDPNSSNDEFRMRFIFKYYDSNGDKILDEEELKKMLKDIHDNCDDDSLDDKISEVTSSLNVESAGITLDVFLRAVNSDALKGAKQLCRSPKQTFAKMKKSMADRHKRKTSAKSKSGFLKDNRKNKGICLSCKGKKYDYGLHSVKLDTSGRCVEPRRIFEPETIREDVVNRDRFSMEYKFDSNAIPQVFLDVIRSYSNKKVKDKSFWAVKGTEKDQDTFLNYVSNLCTDIQSLLKCEDRVMKLNSPTVVIGDIRGNLEHLMLMEKLLWHSFPLVSANYLFLGNFADRGNNGIECVIYILAMKLISPNKMFLLRGNFDTRDVTKNNTFQKECLTKFGHIIGLKVWELINNVFDRMPVSAIIDESIFCAHGGIPYTSSKVSRINDIPLELAYPDRDSLIANEIMNNEPLRPDHGVSKLDKGFAAHKSVGSAHLFNEEAVDNFLEPNGLTHIIRSNNVYNNKGYEMSFEGKCLTICSDYKDNEPAVAFVDSEKIRILTLEKPKNVTHSQSQHPSE